MLDWHVYGKGSGIVEAIVILQAGRDLIRCIGWCNSYIGLLRTFSVLWNAGA